MSSEAGKKSLKVALVCEWLITFAGAEKVAAAILSVFPQADVYAVVDFLPEEHRGWLRGKKVRTTFIQNLPSAKRHYKSYLPLMPLAIEQLDLSGYDLVISSSHCVAKGVLTGPDQIHVSYVHSPMRYAWDLTHQYLREADLVSGLKSWLARFILHYMRIWDTRTANGVDAFIANSEFIARRIKKVYGREAKVIYPPVDIEGFTCCERKENYYLTASRLVPYKRIKLIVEAFNRMPDKRLVVIGNGPEYEKIRVIAKDNVDVLGYQPDEVLKEKMQHAKAFVFAAEEDFGIAPVEAQACGTPVIAYGRGGALETVTDETGLFFSVQDVDTVCEAVTVFEAEGSKSADDCRINAERFGRERFVREFHAYVNQLLRRK